MFDMNSSILRVIPGTNRLYPGTFPVVVISPSMWLLGVCEHYNGMWNLTYDPKQALLYVKRGPVYL